MMVLSYSCHLNLVSGVNDIDVLLVVQGLLLEEDGKVLLHTST